MCSITREEEILPAGSVRIAIVPVRPGYPLNLSEDSALFGDAGLLLCLGCK